MAKFTKRSMFSGIVRTMEFPQYTQDQFDRLYNAWQNRKGLIQEIFTDMNDSEREFLQTGTTDAEWDAEFGDDE